MSPDDDIVGHDRGYTKVPEEESREIGRVYVLTIPRDRGAALISDPKRPEWLKLRRSRW